MSADPSRYVYVDTATGGLNTRNRVMRLEDYRPPPDAVECYVTAFRFTEDLAAYAAKNLSPTTGRPSVAGRRIRPRS